MKISGTSPDGELVEIIEVEDHPWFLGCQFHPEFKSRPTDPHPLFREFIAASLKGKRALFQYDESEVEMKKIKRKSALKQKTMTKEIIIAGAKIGGNNPPLIIAGPCVIESEDVTLHTAQRLKDICSSAGLSFVFKCSYDKANRTSIKSFRGPGIEKGLRILSDIKSKLNIPVISDVHSIAEVKPASEVLDALQIPAFLCRQTDLISAAAKTGKPVNIKKASFLRHGMLKT